MTWAFCFRRILALTWPVLVAQLASIAMMVIDTLVVGHFSTQDLAAVAIGSSIYVSLMLGLAGVVQALGPVVAHDFGAEQHENIGEHLRQGLWLALGLSLPGVWFLNQPGWLLALADVTPDVASKASEYLAWLGWCLPASLLYRTFHGASNALGQPRPLMVIGILQTAGHGLVAVWLVNGGLGVPALGSSGAAMSQALMSWISCSAGMSLLLFGRFWQRYDVFGTWSWPKLSQQITLLKLGVPMGISYMVEITAFTFIALFVAQLGAVVVGAHRIVTNLSATIYMLPLAIATATSALVAQAAGGAREKEAARMAYAGIVLGSGSALMVGLISWLSRDAIVGLGTTDPEVAALAVGLVIYIALYQLPDGIQTVAGFALRGYKVTFLPLLIHLSCFWGLGLGVGYWLAFKAPIPQGVAGFWQATVLSTLGACALLGGLLVWVMRQRSIGQKAEA
jgi:multidrug resistance protein, MATE family